MSVEGVWNWSYNGGTFEVNFAPGGEFVCKSYPAHSHWNIQGNRISINWGKYGKYEMVVAADGRSMEGCYAGYPQDWRKAEFIRQHTAEEKQRFAQDAAHAHSHDHSHDGHCNHAH